MGQSRPPGATALALLWTAIALTTVGTAQEEEPGFVHVQIGSVSYALEAKSAKVMGYDIPGSGGCLRNCLFSESAAPGLDTRGNLPGTVYQKCPEPAEVVTNTDHEAHLTATVELINAYKATVTTNEVAPGRWQTVQHWKRVAGDTPTHVTIRIYTDTAALNRSLLIYPPGEAAPAGAVRIPDDQSVARAPANSQVLFPGGTDMVSLSLDVDFTVQGFFYGSGLCGFAMAFSTEDRGDFRFTIDHRREEAFVKRVGSTTIAVRQPDLTARIWAGPYPFVSCIGLLDGGVTQQMVPTDASPLWSGSTKATRARWSVVGEGHLARNWQEQITVQGSDGRVRCEVSYRTEDTVSGELPPSLYLKLPGRLEGKPLSLRSAGHRVERSPEGIAYRVGAVMEVGRLAGGATAHIALEPMRELVVRPGQETELSLDRAPDASARLVLRPAAPAGTLSVSLDYRHVPPPKPPDTPPFLAPPADEALKVYDHQPDKGDLTISSPYWCVVHRASAGGAISSVRFYHGSRRELLCEPDETSVTANGTRYSSRFCRDAHIEVSRESEDLVRVHAFGPLLSADGESAGLRFSNSYEYHPWYALRRCSIVAERSVPGVGELQVARLALSPALDECYWRPSAWDVARWSRVVFPGPPAFDLPTGWAYIGVFRRGVEGVELFPTSDLTPWEQQTFPGGGRAQYAVVGNDVGGPTILLQPYAHDEPITLDQRLTYDFYMGLPPIKEKPGRPVMGPGVVVGWLSDTSFDEIIDVKPQFLWYHYLLGPAGLVMKNEQSVERVKQEMARFHEAGIRLIAYTWFNSMGSNEDARKKGAEESWFKMPTSDPKSAGGVCYDSEGYREWLKDIEDRMFRQTPVDGIYYDWMGAFTCYNTAHGSGKHYSIDGVLDMLRWTRERLGDDGLIVGHIGGGAGEYPCATLEAYTTGVVTLEELYHGTKLPMIDDVQASLEFMGATPRIVCSALCSVRARRYPESEYVEKVMPVIRELITKCFLWGYFPYRGYGPRELPEGQRFFRYEDLEDNWGYDREFRTLKGIDFSDYTFRSFARQTAVELDNDFARASVFFGDRDALVIIANPDSGDPQEVSFRVDCRHLGWQQRRPSSIEEISFARDGDDALTTEGGTIHLAGHDFRVYRLTR